MANDILFVIDVQEGFIDDQTKTALPAIEKLLRAEWSGIIASRFIGKKGSLYESRLGYCGMRSLVEQDLWHPLAKALPFVVDKTGYSALTDRAKDFLRQFNKPQVHVCGFDTDGCVLATCFALWDAGYAPNLIVEASASTGGKQIHNHALEIAIRSFGAGTPLPL